MKTGLSLLFVGLTSLYSLSAIAAQIQNLTVEDAIRFAERVDAAEYVGVNCSVGFVSRNGGQCSLAFRIHKTDTNPRVFLVAPEVAAVYANSSPYINVPKENFWLVVSKGQIVRINDSQGNAISKKIVFATK